MGKTLQTEQAAIKKLLAQKFKGLTVRECKNEIILSIGQEKYDRNAAVIKTYLQDMKRGKSASRISCSKCKKDKSMCAACKTKAKKLKKIQAQLPQEIKQQEQQEFKQALEQSRRQRNYSEELKSYEIEQPSLECKEEIRIRILEDEEPENLTQQEAQLLVSQYDQTKQMISGWLSDYRKRINNKAFGRHAKVLKRRNQDNRIVTQTFDCYEEKGMKWTEDLSALLKKHERLSFGESIEIADKEADYESSEDCVAKTKLMNNRELEKAIESTLSAEQIQDTYNVKEYTDAVHAHWAVLGNFSHFYNLDTVGYAFQLFMTRMNYDLRPLITTVETEEEQLYYNQQHFLFDLFFKIRNLEPRMVASLWEEVPIHFICQLSRDMQKVYCTQAPEIPWRHLLKMDLELQCRYKRLYQGIPYPKFVQIQGARIWQEITQEKAHNLIVKAQESATPHTLMAITEPSYVRAQINSLPKNEIRSLLDNSLIRINTHNQNNVQDIADVVINGDGPEEGTVEQRDVWLHPSDEEIDDDDAQVQNLIYYELRLQFIRGTMRRIHRQRGFRPAPYLEDPDAMTDSDIEL